MATLNLNSIYLIESDGTDNDDWITDHAGDPDAIDMTDYTEGTEYAEISNINTYTQRFSSGVKVTDLGGGGSLDIKYGKRSYTVSVRGTIDSLASANLLQKMCMIARHTESTGFKRYYLIIKFATSSYVEFIDDSGNAKEYCKGIVISGNITWNEMDNMTWDCSLQFRSVW